MKARNFPARKLKRQLTAQNKSHDDYSKEIDIARERRTKKRRGA